MHFANSLRRYFMARAAFSIVSCHSIILVQCHLMCSQDDDGTLLYYFVLKSVNLFLIGLVQFPLFTPRYGHQCTVISPPTWSRCTQELWFLGPQLGPVSSDTKHMLYRWAVTRSGAAVEASKRKLYQLAVARHAVPAGTLLLIWEKQDD